MQQADMPYTRCYLLICYGNIVNILFDALIRQFYHISIDVYHVKPIPCPPANDTNYLKTEHYFKYFIELTNCRIVIIEYRIAYKYKMIVYVDYSIVYRFWLIV